MKIKVRDIRKATKKIGFQIVQGENLRYEDGACCPLAALSLEKKWDKIQKDIEKAQQKAIKQAKKDYQDQDYDYEDYIDDYFDLYDASIDLKNIEGGCFGKYTKYSEAFITGFIEGFDYGNEFNAQDALLNSRYQHSTTKNKNEYTEGWKNGKHIQKYMVQ